MIGPPAACYLAAMIRMSVTYPAGDGASFDHEYYRSSHIPLCLSTWPQIKEATIDKGVQGPNVAAVHFTFESMDDYQAALGSPGTAKVLADVANYTSIQPVIQVSEIVQ